MLIMNANDTISIDVTGRIIPSTLSALRYSLHTINANQERRINTTQLLSVLGHEYTREFFIPVQEEQFKQRFVPMLQGSTNETQPESKIWFTLSINYNFDFEIRKDPVHVTWEVLPAKESNSLLGGTLWTRLNPQMRKSAEQWNNGGWPN